jgi:hypothetical protein
MAGLTMNASTDFARTYTELEQDPQAAARQAAGAGVRVIGHVGDGVPVALLLAAGALPVRLRGRPDADTSRADAFVESSFPTEHRVIASQWLAGDLDHLDAVVFARGDDAGQRLYYYLCELQRRGLCAGPRALLFDGAGLSRAASLEHTRASVRLLANELGADADSLPGALERLAARTRVLDQAREQGRAGEALAGSFIWRLQFIADCDGREDFAERARQWIRQAPRMTAPRRVLLSGDQLPDDRMHLELERVGASVVMELTGSSVATPDSTRDPLDAIADATRCCESPALSMRRDARWLADAARAHRIDSAVLWLSEQDEALPWEIARQVRELRADGVPTLLLARQPWRITAATLEQVTSFIQNPGSSS